MISLSAAYSFPEHCGYLSVTRPCAKPIMFAAPWHKWADFYNLLVKGGPFEVDLDPCG